MKKHSLFRSLFFATLALTTIAGCHEDHENKDKNKAIDFEVSFIEDLKVDVSGASGFALKKGKIDGAGKKSLSPRLAKIFEFPKLLNDVTEKKTVDENGEEKYFVYTTTTTYSNGNVEYDGSTITKVTFTKSDEVTEDVYDANSSLIDTSTVVTQDSIPAQVNKLYATRSFTFMQFIPVGIESGRSYDYYDEEGKIRKAEIEVRPDSLTYDVNGVSDFDRYEYNCGPLTMNFVIDNLGGYIYKIEDFDIISLGEDRLIKAYPKEGGSSRTYKLKVNSNGELAFVDIMPNPEINEYEIAGTDKYGWTYIFIEDTRIKENSFDQENKIYYHAKASSEVDNRPAIDYDTGEAYLYHFDIKQLGFGSAAMARIEGKFLNGALQPFDVSNTYTTSDFNHYGGFYKGKWYNDGANLFYGTGNKELLEDSLYISGPTDNKDHAVWVNSKYLLSTDESDTLSYMNINFDECIRNPKTVSLNDFTKISDTALTADASYAIKVGDNFVTIENAYYSMSLSGKVYYQLRYENNAVTLVKLEDVAYTANVYLFQPINK